MMERVRCLAGVQGERVGPGVALDWHAGFEKERGGGRSPG
jgi:hypothetical protein